MKRLLLLLLGISLFAIAAPSEAAPDPMRRTPVVVAVEKVSPAVVNISTKKIQEGFANTDFRDFFGRHVVRRPVKSVGSGVIVHRDGYVVTNGHVVRLATEIIVSIEKDGKEQSYSATLLHSDEVNDLALLKIRGGAPCPAVTLGTSDDLMIGEPVIAVGNPFGVGKTVTTGVVSAVNRTVRLDRNRIFKDFIQTDAAINPGNSGGPLLNIHGDLIGVNTAIVRNAEGLGFAIPVDRVKEIIKSLIVAAVDRANLGFKPASDRGGVTVRSLDANGAALKGGLKVGDIIRKVDGREVKSVFDFATPLLSKRPGEVIRVNLLRRGERKELSLTVPLPREIQTIAGRMGILGGNVTAVDRDRGLTGVLVRTVLEDSPASRVGMKKGDVVLAIGRYRMRSVAELAALLDKVEKGRTVRIVVLRAGKEMEGDLTLN